MMRAPALLLRGVDASYASYRALFGVSFAVPDRSIVALLGANGAGKSTVARVATGLVTPTAGQVLIGGVDVARLSAHRIARMGVVHVPEGRGVFASLTVEENLILSFRRRVGRLGVSDALERAYGAFPVLAKRRRQAGGTLSGGEQRMLSLAGVLAEPPRLVVADELSLGLAPVVVDDVYAGLQAIHAQGTALLIVEQQVDRALALADFAVLLARGSVQWQGPAAEARQQMEQVLAAGYGTAG
ncbi:MAG TPA: ABC transporter ATP-binding protein [Acidimicrobiales bacterium]|nr:ABC transporter ATP-binding protein [Acidimicrobiales bacterium]